MNPEAPRRPPILFGSELPQEAARGLPGHALMTEDLFWRLVLLNHHNRMVATSC